MRCHQDLTPEKWYSYSCMKQLANIAVDFERAIEWKNKGEKFHSDAALERGLELLDLTKCDPKNRRRSKELFRLREVFLDYMMGDNEYKSSDQLWHDYFQFFCFAAAKERGR